MPVLVSCSCGKQLRVPDDFIGKSIRCPVCKTVLLATPSGAPTLPTASMPESDTDAAMVRFPCGACGKEMQALAEYGGQETACPDCNATVMIPVRGRPAIGPAVPPLPTAGASTDAETPSARRLRAARPRRRLWPWIGGATVLMLVGVGLVPWLLGYGVFFLFFRDAKAPDLALIPPTAQGFATVRAGDAWKTDALLRLRNEQPEVRDAIKKAEADTGLAIPDCERVTVVFDDVGIGLRAGAGEREPAWWVICLTARPYDKKRLQETFAPGAAELSYQNRKYHVSEGSGSKMAVYFHTDRVFVVGPRAGVHACLDHLGSPKTEGPLKAAIKEAAGKHHFVAGLGPLTEKFRKGLPPAMQDFAPLFEAQSVTARGDLNTALELELTFTYADASKAVEAAAAADGLRKLALDKLPKLKEVAKDKEFLDSLDSTLTGLTVEQKKELVHVRLKTGASVGKLAAALARLRDTAGVSDVGESLRRIAAALKAYHDDPKNKRYPPGAGTRADNKPLLSWRVHLLPYLGEEELYRKFHLNEDYNSPHNRALKDQMPSVYRSPNLLAPMTYYQVCFGPDAPFDGDRQLRKEDIRDGLSNTIAVVEAAIPVEWTSPNDFYFDPTGFQQSMLGRPSADRFSVVMFDGTVHSYQRTIELNKLKALITPSGREPVTP
jgi:DNA-directed RNA polymerase subunit RPC12/RpoP